MCTVKHDYHTVCVVIPNHISNTIRILIRITMKALLACDKDASIFAKFIRLSSHNN